MTKGYKLSIKKPFPLMSHLKSQQGWILADAIIGMIVLSIALTALALSYQQATKGTVAATNQTKAAYIAQQYLSQLRKYDHTGLTRSSKEWNTGPTNYSDSSTNVQYQIKTAVLPASDIPAGLDADVIPVKAIITWTEPSGPRTLEIVTYYYK